MKASYEFHATPLKLPGGKHGVTPLDVAMKDLRKDGGEPDLPHSIQEPFLCDMLGVTPIVLGEMLEEELAVHIGYHLGKRIAEAHSVMVREKSPGGAPPWKMSSSE